MFIGNTSNFKETLCFIDSNFHKTHNPLVEKLYFANSKVKELADLVFLTVTCFGKCIKKIVTRNYFLKPHQSLIDQKTIME